MDKISKALKKLSSVERAVVKKMLLAVKAKAFVGLDLKKLIDREDIFRLRKGQIRIIFRIGANEEIDILAIERRSDTTYSHSKRNF